MQHWTIIRDADGLAWLTFDKAGATVNTLSAAALAELNEALDVLDRDTAAEHLRRSRQVLEHRLGRRVSSFCYPHGYHSRPLRRAVAAAGYANACAIGHRPHRLDGDALAVARVMVVPGTTPDLLRGLVTGGPGGLRPVVTRVATPAWRVVRRTALRMAGVRWT